MMTAKPHCKGSGLALRLLIDANTAQRGQTTRYYCRECKRVLVPTGVGKARPHVEGRT